MKPIGGYFELELWPGNEYHTELIGLNTGRNCLEYILRVRSYKKVYIPYYTCDVLLEPLAKLKVNYAFYTIDRKLEPVIDFEIKRDEALLYTNYFGLKGAAVQKLAKKGFNLIVDNAQAFFDKPLKNMDTFYSPRKFFGVPDGGYLAINKKLGIMLETDVSADRFGHLLKRTEDGPEEGYQDFLRNDRKLIGQPIKKMSTLTRRLLSAIDYEKIAAKRRENFETLHAALGKSNELPVEFSEDALPMVYPYYSSKPGLRDYLIQHKIYVATYWPNVWAWAEKGQWEHKLAQNLMPLPVDQRYGETEMIKMIDLIEKFH